MDITYDMIVVACIVGVAIGFIGGYLLSSSRYSKLNSRPLTYYELTKVPNGSEVLLLQYHGKERGCTYREHGTVYTRKDGSRAIDVGDGDIEFTEADVWLYEGTGG